MQCYALIGGTPLHPMRVFNMFRCGLIFDFLYLFCLYFRKIFGRIKNFEKCTSDAVPHTVPDAVGHSGRSLLLAAERGGAAPGPCRRAARRQVPTAVPHNVRSFFYFF
jgi:hypothetical protein